MRWRLPSNRHQHCAKTLAVCGRWKCCLDALTRLQFGLRKPLAAVPAESKAAGVATKEEPEAVRVTCTDLALEAESVADTEACSPRQARACQTL